MNETENYCMKHMLSHPDPKCPECALEHAVSDKPPKVEGTPIRPGAALRMEFAMPPAKFKMPEKQTQGAEDHPLYPIFMAAIEQAMFGKGERHGGARTPFLEQPWVHYLKMHGRGFATGQAAKKLEEAASTRNGEGFETEVFGAIVYAGMAILKERGQV